MCVKCQLDGELPVGRKAKLLAVHTLHPAAAHDRYKENTCYAQLQDYCKGGIFYVANEETICRLF